MNISTDKAIDRVVTNFEAGLTTQEDCIESINTLIVPPKKYKQEYECKFIDVDGTALRGIN